MIELTEKQKEIINSPAKIKLVMGGERSGKTSTAILNYWEHIKKHNGNVLYLVNNGKLLRSVCREIEYLLSIQESRQVVKPDEIEKITTDFGDIYVSTELIFNKNFEVITIDDSTSNKHAKEVVFIEKLLECDAYIYMTGHIPTDMDNYFFKLWLKYYFLNLSNFKSFRLSTWDNPRMANKRQEYETKLKDSLYLQRYLRQYECIPDYT